MLGGHTFTSRLFVGTGKYPSMESMVEALAVSGTQCVTVAVRRMQLGVPDGKTLLDYLPRERYVLLPNTAGCFDADHAVRTARLGRELGMGDLVKLEVLGDPETLLPDPIGTLEAARTLVGEGFTVLCYTSDDPITAARIKDAGAASVMPAGSPIGSGQGVLNPNNIVLCLEALKRGDPAYPVIVDAGVGAASDVSVAMELGADGVLLNTAIAHARDPVMMAHAMRKACEAGRQSYLAGRIEKRLYATASSPMEGAISYIPGE